MPSPLPMLTEWRKHWPCPCGKWKPDPHQSAQQRWTEVKKHWRICQGEDPPGSQLMFDGVVWARVGYRLQP
eukprot:5730511-Pyramimonas_sp.AAC.1